jgi:hypothetical protein
VRLEFQRNAHERVHARVDERQHAGRFEHVGPVVRRDVRVLVVLRPNVVLGKAYS